MDPKKLIESRHPEYAARASLWAMLAEAFKGGPEYARKHLTRYAAEAEDRYVARQKNAYTLPFCREAVDSVKRRVANTPDEWSYSSDLPEIQEILETDLDGSGSSLPTYVGQTLLETLLTYGAVWVQSTAPQFDPEVLATDRDRIDNNLHPYLVQWLPTNVLNWTPAQYGTGFDRVLLKYSDHPLDPDTGFPSQEAALRFKLWTPEEVSVYDEEGRLLETLPNPIRRVPFFRASLSAALIEDIMALQQAAVDVVGALNSFILESNFPLLTIQGNERSQLNKGSLSGSRVTRQLGGEAASADLTSEVGSTGTDRTSRKARAGDMPMVIGQSRALVLMEGAQAGYIGPSTDNARFNLEYLARIEKQVSSLSLDRMKSVALEKSTVAQSGASKQMDDITMESGIRAALETIVEQIAIPACASLGWWLNRPDPAVAVATPQQFNRVGTETKLDLAERLMSWRETLLARTPTAASVCERAAVRFVVADYATPEETEAIGFELEAVPEAGIRDVPPEDGEETVPDGDQDAGSSPEEL